MHIYRRNRVYYYRIRIPESIRAYFKKTEIHKSLKTANRVTALRYAKTLQSHFEYIKQGILLGRLRDEEIYEAVERFVRLQFERFDKDLYVRHHYEEKADRTLEILSKEITNLEKQIAGKTDFDAVVSSNARSVFDTLDTAPRSNEYDHVCNIIANGLKQAYEAITGKITNGEYLKENPYLRDFISPLLQSARVETPLPPQPLPVKERKPSTPITLRSAYDDFIRHTGSLENWTEDTYGEHQHMRELMFMHFGANRDIQITRQELLDFRNLLTKVPRNRKLKKAYRDLSTLEDIVSKAKELNDATISDTTVNKYLSNIYGMFKYCVDNDIIFKNPVMNLRRKQSKKQKNNKRVGYDNDDLETLFQTPLYLEDIDQTLRTNPEHLFIPLLALFQGARMNELCQLYREDIVQKEGIWCIDINRDGDKSIKNDDSVRLIPIHEKIIQSGFIEYVRSVRTPRLWENLKKYEKYADENDDEGRYSKDFSKWFRTKVNRKFITKDPRKVFHSFRHTAAVTLIDAKVRGEYIAALLGHVQDLPMTFERYGEPIKPSILKPELDRMHYDIANLDDVITSIADAVARR